MRNRGRAGTEGEEMMTDKDSEVIYSPEVLEAIEADPELAEVMRRFAADARQAMQFVKDGKYADFDDAMEALTGVRPQLVEDDELEKLMSGEE